MILLLIMALMQVDVILAAVAVSAFVLTTDSAHIVTIAVPIFA